jgi:hypothetical protein
LDCRCYDRNGKPLDAAAGKPSESTKPLKKYGGNKGMAFMQSMFEAYVKSRRKPVSLRSVRSTTMTPVTVLTVNMKLDTGKRNLE